MNQNKKINQNLTFAFLVLKIFKLDNHRPDEKLLEVQVSDLSSDSWNHELVTLIITYFFLKKFDSLKMNCLILSNMNVIN